jgi:hypothetical protein
MPVAIHTHYIGPAAVRGARVKASIRRDKATLWSVTVPYDHAATCAHTVAAQALADKYWPGRTVALVGAALDGKGDVFTLKD